MISEEEKKRLRAMDVTNEGRGSNMMDIDRMINEGMAGGRTHRDQIELATEIPEDEQPPLSY